jgi:hypothetical protein
MLLKAAGKKQNVTPLAIFGNGKSISKWMFRAGKYGEKAMTWWFNNAENQSLMSFRYVFSSVFLELMLSNSIHLFCRPFWDFWAVESHLPNQQIIFPSFWVSQPSALIKMFSGLRSRYTMFNS